MECNYLALPPKVFANNHCVNKYGVVLFAEDESTLGLNEYMQSRRIFPEMVKGMVEIVTMQYVSQ